MFSTRFRAFALLAFLIIVLTGRLYSADFAEGPEIRLQGDLAEASQLSGSAFHQGLLVLAGDEGAAFNILRKVNERQYSLLRAPKLLEKKKEIDMEAAASDGKAVYLLGSTSLVRPKLDPRDTYAKNRQTLAKVKEQTSRDALWRVTLDESGEVTSTATLELAPLLTEDPILSRFVNIPSKENGIDLEGLAILNERLFIGCRGPVLRENNVPVIVVSFDQPKQYELRFVQLGGRGIRDLLFVGDALLILAGPVGDGEGDYPLYSWDGLDCLPGTGAPRGRLVKLGEVPAKPGSKPEGIALLDDRAEYWQILVVSDGYPNARQFRVPRP